MRKLSLFLVLVMLLGFSAGLAEQQEYTEFTEVTFLSCWNGGGGSFPEDIMGNMIAQEIAKKTGVIVNMESIVTSETERLNTMFASGVMPDFVNAPYWSSTSNEGFVIRKAALEGMIYDISPVLDQYPNIKRLFEVGVAKDYLQFDVFNPEYEGKIYVIPQQTPSDDPRDITNWAYGIFGRKDILEALDVDPASIDTTEKLYDLAVKIKEGGFKDAAGKDVIPMGTSHNGWNYWGFLDGFGDGYHLSSYRQLEDGSIVNTFFTQRTIDQTLFMRKLVAEGLMDVEAFSNTDTMGKEKMAIGKCALFSFHAPYLVETMRETLYKTNPEMEYVRVGPLKMTDGNIVTAVEKVGRTGSPVHFIAASSEKKEEVLRFLDFINSEEGRLLARYGIEGVHYDMVDGFPTVKPELREEWAENPAARRNLGIGVYEQFIGAYDYDSKYPMPEDQKNQWDKMLDSLRAGVPIVQFDKVSVGFLDRGYPKMEEYRDLTSTINVEDERRRAYFAESDEDAIAIIEATRQRYLDAGIQDLFDYVKEQYEAYPNKDELMF
jgi:putative aldouronate transport system substrate-binding protein